MKARRRGSTKRRRMKSVHVDRIAEQLVMRMLAEPEFFETLASEAVETETGSVNGELQDIEAAAEREAALPSTEAHPSAVEAPNPNPDHESPTPGS